jgi:hypothetical protein
VKKITRLHDDGRRDRGATCQYEQTQGKKKNPYLQSPDETKQERHQMFRYHPMQANCTGYQMPNPSRLPKQKRQIIIPNTIMSKRNIVTVINKLGVPVHQTSFA